MLEELERLKARVGDLEARPRSSNSHQAPPPSISPNIIVNVPGGPYTTSPQNMGQSPTPSPHASVNGLENLDSTQRRRGWEEGNGMQEDTHGKAASDAAYIKTLEGALEEARGSAADAHAAASQAAQERDELQQAYEEAAAQAALAEQQVQVLQADLENAQEERYQLQVALRAAQKEVERLRSLLAANSSGNKVARATSPMSQHSQPSQAPADGLGHKHAQQQAKLEGALRQAMADYQMLLKEVAGIRSQVSSRDAALQQCNLDKGKLEAALQAARAEAARLGALARDSDMRASKLSRALEECEAHRRRFEDLEGCHSSVKQRLEAARASDDLFNRTSQRQQSLQENPPASPARRGEKIRYIPPTGFM